MNEKFHVYLSPDEKISLMSRNLVECGLDDDTLANDMYSEIVQYMRTKQGFVYPCNDVHNKNISAADNIEAFFYVPQEKSEFESVYGDAPKVIADKILACMRLNEQNNAVDTGYVLIGFFP